MRICSEIFRKFLVCWNYYLQSLSRRITDSKMQNIIIFSVLASSCLFYTCSSINVEDNPVDPVVDAAKTLEELEVEIFQEVVAAELDIPRARTISPKKCCKTGKKVAESGLYCNIDLMQVQKKNNNVFKRKMKWQGPEEAGKLQYKDLLMRAEKCYPSKSTRSMFMKCCELQQSRQNDLADCKRLKTREARKACRRQVKGKGDY